MAFTIAYIKVANANQLSTKGKIRNNFKKFFNLSPYKCSQRDSGSDFYKQFLRVQFSPFHFFMNLLNPVVDGELLMLFRQAVSADDSPKGPRTGPIG